MGVSIGVNEPRSPAVSGEALPTASSCSGPGVKRNIFPAEFGSFSAATWNSNGLLGACCENARDKIRYAKGLMNNSDVMFLQEVHGDAAAATKWANTFRKTHECFFSLLPEAAKGGVAICVKKQLLKLAVEKPIVEVLEAGRVMTIVLKMPLGTIAAVCAHHFDLQKERETVSKIAKLIEDARCDAAGRSFAILGGDFNYTVPGEMAARVGVEGAAFPTTEASSFSRSRAAVWAPALSKCVELHQQWPTRGGNAENKKGDKYFIATRIDRIYFSGTPLACTLLNISRKRV